MALSSRDENVAVGHSLWWLKEKTMRERDAEEKFLQYVQTLDDKKAAEVVSAIFSIDIKVDKEATAKGQRAEIDFANRPPLPASKSIYTKDQKVEKYKKACQGQPWGTYLNYLWYRYRFTRSNKSNIIHTYSFFKRELKLLLHLPQIRYRVKWFWRAYLSNILSIYYWPKKKITDWQRRRKWNKRDGDYLGV